MLEITSAQQSDSDGTAGTGGLAALLSSGPPGLREEAGGLLESMLHLWPSQGFWEALGAIVLRLSQVCH